MSRIDTERPAPTSLTDQFWWYIDCREIDGLASFCHLLVRANTDAEAYAKGGRLVGLLTDEQKAAHHGHFEGRFLNDYVFEAALTTSRSLTDRSPTKEETRAKLYAPTAPASVGAVLGSIEWRRMGWSHVQTSRDGRWRIEERTNGWLLFERSKVLNPRINRPTTIAESRGTYPTRDAAQRAAEART